MIAKCLNCNQDYDQETQGAICPHAVGGPNKGDPWPTLKQPYKYNRKWVATYSLNGKLKHIGYYRTKKEAIVARKAAVKSLPYIL
jgi:hypothetical protein